MQLSMSLNLLTGYKEAFLHWYLPNTERVSKCPMHLAGVGGDVIEWGIRSPLCKCRGRRRERGVVGVRR